MTGVLMFQMPLDRITEVMSERAGLGETGETYLIGSDKLMRSDSYLDPKYHSVVASFRNPEKGKVETKAADNALAGKKGAEIVTDYNGNPVLSSYTPVDILGTKWALLAEIDEAEAFAAQAALMKLMMIIGLVGAAIIAACCFFIARNFANPITAMTSAMQGLAGGNLDADIPALDRKDEIGEMAGAVQVFKENAIEMKRLEAEQKEVEKNAEKQKKALMKKWRRNSNRVSAVSSKQLPLLQRKCLLLLSPCHRSRMRPKRNRWRWHQPRSRLQPMCRPSLRLPKNSRPPLPR